LLLLEICGRSLVLVGLLELVVLTRMVGVVIVVSQPGGTSIIRAFARAIASNARYSERATATLLLLLVLRGAACGKV